MRRTDEERLHEFLVARLDALRRTAYLLCRDWHTADDLVAVTIDKLYPKWSRVAGAENPDAYVRGMLANVWLDERRRPWRRERPHRGRATDRRRPRPAIDVPVREALFGLLESLPPRQRAVVVLRFYGDLSVEETAATLGLPHGSVKSQTSRGLAALRALAGNGSHAEGK